MRDRHPRGPDQSPGRQVLIRSAVVAGLLATAAVGHETGATTTVGYGATRGIDYAGEQTANAASTLAGWTLEAAGFGDAPDTFTQDTAPENNPAAGDASDSALTVPDGEGFYIVGSDIVAPDGEIFYPLGANVGIQNAFDWEGVATGHAAEALEWGWNTIRLNFACTNRATYNTRYKDGYDTLRKQVDEVIAEYTAQGIVVIIECHDPYAEVWATPELQNTVRLQPGDPEVNAKNQSDAGKTYKDQMEQFWTDSADQYKTNPYVWFNPWNEPFGTDNDAFIELNTHFYDLIRSRGAENIIIADAMNSGNDAGDNGALRMYHPDMAPKLAAGKCNMMFSLHAYGWGNSPESYRELFDQMQSHELALIVGEYGYTVDQSSTAGGYAENKMAADAMHALGPEYGVGLQAWHATHGDKYSLKASGGAFYADGGAGANLSQFGLELWDIGHNKPDLGTFSGDIAASNCASKQ